jgi:pimeloyl-ACP methyl ester carboxylesterase
LQKTLRNSLVLSITFFSLIIILSAFNVIRKDSVSFSSADGLLITADEYIIEQDNPYILLLHQQQSSRGEFSTIAPKLCKMDYNCLAVDVRNGGNDNYVSNETVKRCRESRCSLSPTDIEGDILAAVSYAFEKSQHPVILFGSGANGSLCLKIARENDNVRAVIALSPGEYFLPDINIRDTIAQIRKPVFVTSSLSEFPYVKEVVSKVPEDYLNAFEPKMGEGGRGTVSLSNDTENHSEYWLALLLFFKDLL